MKSIKYFLIFISLGLLTVQCTKLDETVYTKLAPSNFYKTEDELNMAVTNVYTSYRKSFGDYKYYMYLECLTEFGAPAYAKDNANLWKAWVDVNNASTTTFSFWSNAYSVINNANVVLGRGAAMDVPESTKNKLFAEVRLLRAMTYYNLVRIYGGVPIPTSYTESLSGLSIPRQTVDSTYSYLINDLMYAKNNLPVKSKATDKWRVTKGTAEAFLGEVYLTRGSMTGNSSYFSLAKDYCDSVISSNEYALESNYKDLWYWWNTNNKNGKESIYELQYGHYNGQSNSLHIMFGLNITETTLGCYMYRRFGPTIAAYQSFSNSDTRKEATFLTRFYRTEKGNPSHILDTLVFVPEDKGFYPGSRGWNTASPGNIKFYDRTTESSTLQYPAADLYIMRYSEVLLNYAEAENELHGATADAYDKINQVRRRAQLTDLSGLSKEQLADSIYRERGWEFIGEGKLYYDELRTNRLGANVKKEVSDGVAKGIYMYQNLEFVPSKNFLWKIPQYDFDSNPALVQNPDNVSQ